MPYGFLGGAAGGTTVGAPKFNVTSIKVANYSAVINDYVRVNPTGGTFTVTLPAPDASNIGLSVVVKNVTHDLTLVTIATAGGLIDGFATQPLQGDEAEETFTSDGTNWMGGL